MECDEHGNFEYEGETKVFWDGQVTMQDGWGQVIALCEQGHQWPVIDADDPDAKLITKRYPQEKASP